REFAAENFLPVRPPLDLLHALARNERTWTGRRKCLELRRSLQVLVIERERLVIIVDFRQIWVRKNLRKHAPLAADFRLYFSTRLTRPAAIPAVLVFPVFRISDSGLRLDVVEPRVFHALAIGPNVLASDRARVAANALVEVEHHCDLSTDFHGLTSSRTFIPPNAA